MLQWYFDRSQSESGVKTSLCCGSALVSLRIPESSILGQCGSRILMTNFKNISRTKTNIFWTKFQFTYSLHGGSPSYRRSLQPSKKNTQHCKIYNFFPFFWFWGSFCPAVSGSSQPKPMRILNTAFSWRKLDDYLKFCRCSLLIELTCCPVLFRCCGWWAPSPSGWQAMFPPPGTCISSFQRNVTCDSFWAFFHCISCFRGYIVPIISLELGGWKGDRWLKGRWVTG